MTNIESILLESGPLISSELAKRLEILESIPNNTASQRITRAKEVKKIKGFFVSNQSLCYLEIHSKDKNLYESFSRALFEFGRKYWYCLNALKLHGGIITRKYLECYTNYPILALKGHLPFDKVMQKFVAEEVIIFNHDDYYFSPRFLDVSSTSLTSKTIEIVKESILQNFKTLTKNIGLISYNTGELFAEFGKFRWAFKGVSSVSGLKDGDKYGYILADILIGANTYKNDVLFFVEKLKHIQSFNNSSRIIPFLIIDDLDNEALNYLKKNGVVIGFIKELFGEKYAESIKDLVTILNNAGASLKNNPDKYLELINQLRKYNEGLINNIRGTLFEYVVGHIHSVKCQSIEIGREIFENSSKHEIDVRAIYSDKIVIAECKATKSKINLYQIEDWLNFKIPAFRQYISKQETWSNKSIEFEYWSTSGFTKEAKEMLDKAVLEYKKVKVSYYSSNNLREIAVVMKNKKLKECLDDYFLKIEV